MGNLQCRNASEADENNLFLDGSRSRSHNNISTKQKHPNHPPLPSDEPTATVNQCRRKIDSARCQEAAARQFLQEARIRVLAAQARVETQQFKVEQAQKRKAKADHVHQTRAAARQQQRQSSPLQNTVATAGKDAPFSGEQQQQQAGWWLEHARKAVREAELALQKEMDLLEKETLEWEEAKAPIQELNDELERRRSHVKEMVAAAEAFQKHFSRQNINHNNNHNSRSSKFMKDSLMTELMSHLDSITEHYTTIPIPTEISVLDTSDETLSDIGDEEADLNASGPSSWNTTSDDSSSASPALSPPQEKLCASPDVNSCILPEQIHA